MRHVALALHRIVGLALAGFLVIIGTTGSIIVFFNELDEWANPGLLRVQPGANHVDFIKLRAALQAGDPRSHIYGINFPQDATETVSFYVEGAVDPGTGAIVDLPYDQVFADPYTGRRLGERHWGDLSLDSKDLTTFIFFLHYSLILPEDFGEPFMGVVALVFAFDCLVALYLTFPRLQPRAGHERASFLRRWKRSWLVETAGSRFRIVFDWHRASGLWIWPMLLVFAMSGFAFNLPSTYAAIMGRITHYVDVDAMPWRAAPLVSPAIDWPTAMALGQTYMRAAAESQGFTIEHPAALIYRREKGLYDYRVQSSRDISIYGYTSVAIDATSGALLAVELPTGQYAGNTFTSWIKALHQGMVFGLPYRLLCSALGLTLVALTITGVSIWYRRQFGRGPKPAAGTSGRHDGVEMRSARDLKSPAE